MLIENFCRQKQNKTKQNKKPAKLIVQSTRDKHLFIFLFIVSISCGKHVRVHHVRAFFSAIVVEAKFNHRMHLSTPLQIWKQMQTFKRARAMRSQSNIFYNFTIL
jgi:hypothetical protein